MEKTPAALPEIEKSEISDPNFSEKDSEAKTNRSATLWIIILAFALLASLGVIIWLVFSGRADQKIHGENLENFRSSEEKPENEPSTEASQKLIVEGNTVNLSDYSHDILLTASGNITLSGVFEDTIYVKRDVVSSLILDGAILPTFHSSPILYDDTNEPAEININFASGKTSFLMGRSETGLDTYTFSGQSSVIFKTPERIETNQLITLRCDAKNVSLSHATMGYLESFVYSSPELQDCDSYDVYVDKTLIGTGVYNKSTL